MLPPSCSGFPSVLLRRLWVIFFLFLSGSAGFLGACAHVSSGTGSRGGPWKRMCRAKEFRWGDHVSFGRWRYSFFLTYRVWIVFASGLLEGFAPVLHRRCAASLVGCWIGGMCCGFQRLSSIEQHLNQRQRIILSDIFRNKKDALASSYPDISSFA